MLHQQSTIRVGYSPVIHTGVVRQAAVIEGINITKRGFMKHSKSKIGGASSMKAGAVVGGGDGTASPPPPAILRTGDRANVTFRFAYKGEYIVPGSMMLFREGSAKGVGKITRIVEYWE